MFHFFVVLYIFFKILWKILIGISEFVDFYLGSVDILIVLVLAIHKRVFSFFCIVCLSLVYSVCGCVGSARC